MKYQISLFRKTLYGIMLLLVFLSAFGRENFHSVRALGTHTITYFRGNKAGAVSFTFDDGYITQVTTALSQLNARGIKGTFFVVTGTNWINGHVSWATWQSIVAQGHEVASHTVTHPLLTELLESEMQSELSESQFAITQNVPGQACASIAYPEGDTNDTVQALTAEYYNAGRATYAEESGFLNYYESGQDQFDSWGAINFYDIGSLSGDSITISNQNFINQANRAISRHAWFGLHFHQVNDETAFGNMLDYIQGNQNYWIDTFCNVSRYMKERLNSTVEVITDNSSEIRLDIVMNASLPTATYNFPLTIRSTVPESWNEVGFQQGSSMLTLIPVLEGAEKVVYYDAVPNGGDIVLTNLAAFSKTDPINGATNQPLGPTLSWSASTGATSYEYCYDTTNNNACSNWTSNGTATTATLTNLTPSTTHYWHVRAVNGGGTTYAEASNIAFWSFTTIPNPPAGFNKSSPAHGAINQPVNPTLTWAASTGAASYEYCYDTTNDNTCSGWTSNGTLTSKTLSGLTPGSTYYWHVRGVNYSGTTYSNNGGSTFWSFTISCYALTQNANPGAGGTINTSPAPNCNNGTQYIYGTEVTMTATANPGHAFFNWSGDVSGSFNSVNVTMTADKFVNVTFASLTTTLASPSLRSPQSNLLTLNPRPTMSWSSVKGAQKYEIAFAMDKNFSNIIESKVISGLLSSVATDLSDNKYYWRVRAYNANNQYSKWSLVRTFTVDRTAPAVPVLSFPGSGANTRTPTFKWGVVATAVSYELQYAAEEDATEEGFTNPIYTVVVKGNFRKPPAMKVGTYYWHVRAKDAAGNWSEWSEPFILTITK